MAFLSKKEDLFAKLLVEGKEVVDAYTVAFAGEYEHMSEEELLNEARKLARTKRINLRKTEIFEEGRQQLMGDRVYSFDKSVRTLEYVVNNVIEELELIKTAKFEELDKLQHKFDMETDPVKRDKIHDLILKKAQWKHLTQAQLQSMIMATSELNKMHGYNEENINLQAPIIFHGEDELEE